MKKMLDSEKDAYEGTNGVVRHHLTSRPVSMVIVFLLTTPPFYVLYNKYDFCEHF